MELEVDEDKHLSHRNTSVCPVLPDHSYDF